MYDSDESARPFYRELNDTQLEQIKFCVTRLVDWKMWSSPVNAEIDQVRLDNQRELLVEAAGTHAPVAECRNLLATPTPTATALPDPAPMVPGVEVVPLLACPTGTPAPSPAPNNN